MLVLTGDIGGTKAHLALYALNDGTLALKRESIFLAKNYTRFEEIARAFMGAEELTAACLGVAAPRYKGQIRMANLPWTFDASELAATLNVQKVHLLNDLEAHGYGIAQLLPENIFTLNPGNDGLEEPRALIAAGTGLGTSFLTWNGRRHVPHPSEGGHIDFAPRNDDELGLLSYLRQKYNGRVSIERVVSGPGITNIYRYLRDVGRMHEPAWLAEEIAQCDDPNSIVTALALAGQCALCEKTMDMFVSAYGAAAGNLALMATATGGLYIGGGIAPRILEKLKDGRFMDAFLDKGRLRWLLEAVPVRIILDSTTALQGAAAYAEALIAQILRR